MNTEFDPAKGEFGIGNGINEYNDQEERAKRAKGGKKAPAQAGGAEDGDNDPVADLNAPEAIEKIGRMRSKDNLQSIVASDPRATVKDAAQKRLEALG